MANILTIQTTNRLNKLPHNLLDGYFVIQKATILLNVIFKGNFACTFHNEVSLLTFRVLKEVDIPYDASKCTGLQVLQNLNFSLRAQKYSFVGGLVYFND